MTTHAARAPMERGAVADRQDLRWTWVVAGFLPLPILVTIDPATSGEIACLYLGLANAWLATEICRVRREPESRRAWAAMSGTICGAIAVNVAVFILFGIAAGVHTNIPFPLMATFSAVPAVGLIPWLMRRVGNQYGAILLGALLVFAGKLTGCVIARIIYGSNYIAEGYVSDDWNTAKLMISIFWALSIAMSAAALVTDYLQCNSRFNDHTPALNDP